MTDTELRAALSALPQAGADVCRHMTQYGKDSKATQVMLAVSLSVGTVESLAMSMETFVALMKVKGAVKRQGRSNARKGMDGCKTRDHYRLEPRRIAEILREVVGDRSDRILPWFGLRWGSKKSLKADQDAFCAQFNCRLVQKPEDESDESKVYTCGDFYEYSAWCALGENPTNWRKNCRSHKTGTDCGEWEIKSACSYWTGSAILVGINQYI